MNRTTTISHPFQSTSSDEADREIRSENDSPETPDSSTDAAQEHLTVPFPRRVIVQDTSLVADDILPSGVLLEFVPADFLNAFINYVDLRSVITERDPEEDDRYITVSNRFYTHFHEFGTVVHVVASSATHWWYFCYDIDASDCAIGRADQETVPLPDLVQWIYRKRVSGRYPTLEIDVRKLTGWRSFQ